MTKQKFDGGVSFEGRIGEINIPWGLSTAIPGGLFYAVNAVDYSAVVRPGAQAAELTIPTPGVFSRLGFLQDKATLESFLLFQGPRSVVPGCGTFFSYADWAAPGCNNVFFSPALADPTSYATDFALNRKRAATPNDVNFGAGGTYTADSLLTKFGLYYAHVDQPTPVGQTIKTLRPGPNLLAAGQSWRSQFRLQRRLPWRSRFSHDQLHHANQGHDALRRICLQPEQARQLQRRGPRLCRRRAPVSVAFARHLQYAASWRRCPRLRSP